MRNKTNANEWYSDDNSIIIDQNIIESVEGKIANKEVSKIASKIFNTPVISENNIHNKIKKIEDSQKDLHKKNNWTMAILVIAFITLAIATIGRVTDLIQYRRGKTNDLENKIIELQEQINDLNYEINKTNSNFESNQKSQKLYIDNAIKDTYIKLLENKPIN